MGIQALLDVSGGLSCQPSCHPLGAASHSCRSQHSVSYVRNQACRWAGHRSELWVCQTLRREAATPMAELR